MAFNNFWGNFLFIFSHLLQHHWIRKQGSRFLFCATFTLNMYHLMCHPRFWSGSILLMKAPPTYLFVIPWRVSALYFLHRHPFNFPNTWCRNNFDEYQQNNLYIIINSWQNISLSSVYQFSYYFWSSCSLISTVLY